MSTITVDDYRTDVDKRAKVDRLVAAAGLDPDDVFEVVELAGNRYRFGMFVRDADGKIVHEHSRWSPAVRTWVERWLP